MPARSTTGGRGSQSRGLAKRSIEKSTGKRSAKKIPPKKKQADAKEKGLSKGKAQKAPKMNSTDRGMKGVGKRSGSSTVTSPAAKKKVAKVMQEWKQGTLKSGRSDKKVKSRDQAIAIALSEARETEENSNS
jgi:hypothetical protein